MINQPKTLGVGGSDAATELAALTDMTAGIQDIGLDELQARITRAQTLMKANGLAAIYVNAGTNLRYFTGTNWYASERMVGAIIPADGELEYIAPFFEVGTLEGYMQIKGRVNTWQEDESPYALTLSVLARMGICQGNIGIDESTAFFVFDGLRQQANEYQWISATAVTAGCRMHKSAHELAIMQRAMDMTLVVHQAVARILRPGISTQEVEAFIHQAHKQVGAAAGSYFCIVLFGEDSSFPHGVSHPKCLDDNDIVLIDTGCQLFGYKSDITRTYVYGVANERQRQMWALEKAAQGAAFNAATLGVACEHADLAAREVLEAAGMGPDYQVPGLPHRTGHGIGLDIHEWPYLVKGNQMPLAIGMCFSNEPMLVLPREFGVRLEDHFYMTAQGPKWFTEPAHSIDDPFGYQA
ncbi:Xaa-Pro peptidase family protein [Shewanella sp. NIFS-20-20]|uniref:M24 family metallopeptidase n=1 Tax=Shewanella sp. NIFS-20-20 TaxID=2853806 RepID=UPI001C491088|nr:Xaa-Pro peptidase family protein [Shewanella sp. NIFS-20-20]MBV7314498.1 Xaa-Pro peptidase family protein [Shewanella sp. NIFS-20-20]